MSKEQKEAFHSLYERIKQRVYDIQNIDTDAARLISCNEINAAATTLRDLSRVCAVAIINKQMGG